MLLPLLGSYNFVVEFDWVLVPVFLPFLLYSSEGCFGPECPQARFSRKPPSGMFLGGRPLPLPCGLCYPVGCLRPLLVLPWPELPA